MSRYERKFQRKDSMSTNEMSGEDLNQLIGNLKEEPQRRQPNPLEIACGGQLLLVQTPADIVLKSGTVVHCNDIQSWGWTPFGVLTVGVLDDEALDEENWKSRLYAADEVSHIDFNRQRYEEIITEIEKEEGAESGSEPGDDDGIDSGDSESDDAGVEYADAG